MSVLTQTEIGKLPDDWKVVRLNDISDPPQYGFTASALEKGNAKLLRITDIKGFSIDWKSVPFCKCDEDQIEKYFIAENDILFARIGATTGKSCIIKCPPDAVFASYLIRVRTKENIDPNYVYFFFQSDKYWSQINENKNDNLKKGVNASVLKSLIVPLPPTKDEQRRIAAILSTIQSAIEQQERLIALTTELKKALMHKLFTEGTRGEPQKETEIGPVPESWIIRRVSEIATLQSGGTPSRKKQEYWNGGNIPWVKTGEVDYCCIKDTEEKITSEGLNNSSAKVFPPETLIMAMYGQGITRGKVAILGIDAATNQACVAFFLKGKVQTNYLYYLFEYKYEELRLLGHGANQKNLSADILKSYEIFFPKDITEQNEIVEILNSIDKKILNTIKQKKEYSDLFRTLLHQLMTAQIRVNDIDLSELGIEPPTSNSVEAAA